MIELRDVSLEVGEFRLGPLSLRIERGEHVLLCGPSGAGKSLTLELIAGFRQPHTGAVMLRDRDVAAVPPQDRHAAWVPQAHTLFPHLSVADNIAFGLRARGATAAERHEAVTRWAQRLGIAALTERTIGGLSGGERQRVAFARALAVQTDLLLLDEPFANLEPERRSDLTGLLAELHHELGLTILHATHHGSVYGAEKRRLTIQAGRLQA